MAKGRRLTVGSKLKDNGLETARAYRTEMGITDGLNFHNTARYELLLNREFMRGASHKAIRYVYIHAGIEVIQSQSKGIIYVGVRFCLWR